MVLLKERPLLLWVDGSAQSAIWAMHGVNGMRVQLSESNVTAVSPGVAACGDRAIAVWTQSYGASTNILSSRHTAEGAWTPPERISDGMGAASLPRVAIDARGRALATWEQIVPEGSVALAAEYSPEKGWSAPKTISWPRPIGPRPIAVLEPGGNGYVFWVEQNPATDGTIVEAQGARFLAGRGFDEHFGGFYEAGLPMGGGLRGFDAEIDHSGRIVVAWFDDNGLRVSRLE